jgi:hypothetical protein
MLATALAAAALLGGTPFTADVTNPYLPFSPGTRWVYRGVDGGRASRDVVTVRRRTEVVGGVACRAVRDRLFLDGRLAEDTLDYYAQDAHGTVWYFGEDTRELDRHGRVTSTEGSWRAGVDGARPGVVMPPRPRVGQRFEQEHYPGHAEDRFKVVTVAGDGVLTEEWTPLEPGVRERKWYVRGVGMISAVTTKGPREHADLVSLQ